MQGLRLYLAEFTMYATAALTSSSVKLDFPPLGQADTRDDASAKINDNFTF